MEKSFYMILVAIAGIAVVYLSGEWIGRGYALINERLSRQVYEAYGKATERHTDKCMRRMGKLRNGIPPIPRSNWPTFSGRN